MKALLASLVGSDSFVTIRHNSSFFAALLSNTNNSHSYTIPCHKLCLISPVHQVRDPITTTTDSELIKENSYVWIPIFDFKLDLSFSSSLFCLIVKGGNRNRLPHPQINE